MRLIDPLPGHYDAFDPFGTYRPQTGRTHTGSDWIVPIGTPVPAIGTGTVTAKGYSSYNGTYVTVLLPDGHYYAYIHLLDVLVDIGETVTIGHIIAHSGQSGSNANISDLGGPHLHVTVSGSPMAADGYGPLTDPWAFIQAHINDTDPVTAPEEEEEEPDMYLVKRILDGDPTLNGMTAAMGPGYFQHLGSGDLEGIARDLKIPDSKIIKGQETNGGNGLPAIEFSRLVSLFQIPSQYVKPGGRYLAGGQLNN